MVCPAASKNTDPLLFTLSPCPYVCFSHPPLMLPFAHFHSLHRPRPLSVATLPLSFAFLTPSSRPLFCTLCFPSSAVRALLRVTLHWPLCTTNASSPILHFSDLCTFHPVLSLAVALFRCMLSRSILLPRSFPAALPVVCLLPPVCVSHSLLPTLCPPCLPVYSCFILFGYLSPFPRLVFAACPLQLVHCLALFF